MGKPKEDSGTWLMTYGDMVTLLLVFFVLLYTMTPGVEEEAFTAFIQFFQKSSGVMEANNAVSSQLQNNINPEQPEDLMEEQMEKWQVMASFAESTSGLEGVTMEASEGGFIITLNDSVAFPSGSSQLLGSAKEILDEMAESINSGIWEIEVQGHTDNIPISGGSVHQTNWHLGAARAVSVVQYMQTSSDISPEDFKASSYGEFRPIANNKTVEGRRANRRVEIHLQEKKTVEAIQKRKSTIDLKTEGLDEIKQD